MPPDALDPVRPAATSLTAFVGATGRGPVGTPVRVTGLDDYRATFAAADPSALDEAVSLFFVNGGAEAVVVRAAGPAADQVVPTSGTGGLRAITGRFTVLVLPGVTSEDHLAVELAAARCAEERAVLLLDLPEGADAATAVRTTDRVHSARERVAAYHPWLRAGERTVPPSGAVAGVLARVDATDGVWASPAGARGGLVGVDSTTTALDDREAELLTAGGINPVRTVEDRGTVLRGVRVLGARDGAEPAQRYLPVRRLTDQVLESLEDGMAFVRERRADPGLDDLIRRRAEEFLTALWLRGALAGQQPEQAFFVRCDGSTTTPGDRAEGRAVLLVGLATSKPAEFEVHRIVLETSTARPPQVLPAARAVARATGLARERLTVARTVDLAPLVSTDADETRRRIEREFAEAADAGTVLLLRGADAVLRDGGRRRPAEIARLLDETSRHTGVPYVLGARH
ncbi:MULTISPECIES: phage tail sheath subtilisin-like domain-containing protein [unclassified Ornithinimicrobium]|uniref:phage tail sheath subtilisin-like domain-containing protein n=1 Tax=unclassified Ornithinimicrobium TaxID=2615080 RepID=UPI003853CA4C